MSEDVFTSMANTLVDRCADSGSIVADVDADIVAAIRGAVALRGAADHALACLTSQAERVGVAKRCGMSLRELLSANGVAPSVASRLQRLGRAIHVLPGVARHSRDATISAEHLDAVTRGIEHIARRTGQPVDSDVVADVEPGLIARAIAGNPPADIVEHARAVAIELTEADESEEGVADRLPPAENTQLNELGWNTTDDGRLRGEFDLDSLTAERLISALDTASRPRPEPDGSDDPRPVALRRADAFAQLLDCGIHGLAPTGVRGLSKTELILTIPIGTGPGPGPGPGDNPQAATAQPARLQWMGPITELTAKLAACNASITAIGHDLDGAPLDISVTQRLFTGAIRKQIEWRDKGCVKCGAPTSWTDCHHIVHYAHGGPTTVDNGALLCRSCHVAVHHTGWDIIMGSDRHPWLIPPASIDPRRRPQPSYHRRTLRFDDPIAA